MEPRPRGDAPGARVVDEVVVQPNGVFDEVGVDGHGMGEPVEAGLHDLVEEGILVAEPGVDALLARFRGLGDAIDAGAGDAVLGEFGRSRFEHALFRLATADLIARCGFRTH